MPTLVKRKKESTGRRRDSSKYQAILQVTRELVDEKGYRALSLKLIASRAKVSRNVLYNWWDGNITHIVEEALLPNVAEWPTPNTGNFASDIDAFLDLTIEAIYKPNILRGFLVLAAEIVNDSDELVQTSKYFRAPYAKIIGQIIKNAEQRNEIAPGLEATTIAQIISGSVMQFAISKKPGKRKMKSIMSAFIQKVAQK